MSIKESIYGDATLPLVVGSEVAYLTATTPDSMRQTFISKVYSILWCQILFTSLFIGLCNQNEKVAYFMQSLNGQNIFVMCAMILFMLTISMFCCHGVIKEKPYNWMYVITYTVLTTYIIGIVGVMYNTQTLLLGGLSTLSIFTGLSLYALQTKYDYTQMGNYLIVMLLSLIIFGFIVSFTTIPLLNTIYSIGGTVIFSLYIIYDTQLIVGGKHRSIQFSTDDFVIASISLYLDIINMFLYILDLTNGR